MTMDLIKVGDNGQLEFDFESLELLVGSEAVKDLKREIEWLQIVDCKLSISEDAIKLAISGRTPFDSIFYVSFIFFKSSKTNRISILDSYQLQNILSLKQR